MPTASHQPAAVTRRTALGGLGLVGVGASGVACSGPADRPTTAPGTTAPVTPTADAVDADQELVEAVLASIAATRALVVTVRRRQPALADALAPLVRMHAAHGRALGDLPAVADRPTTAREQTAAQAQVVTAEQRLQDRVAEATVAARSGILAAVLGSVTASLAQHLTALTGSGTDAS